MCHNLDLKTYITNISLSSKTINVIDLFISRFILSKKRNRHTHKVCMYICTVVGNVLHAESDTSGTQK